MESIQEDINPNEHLREEEELYERLTNMKNMLDENIFIIRTALERMIEMYEACQQDSFFTKYAKLKEAIHPIILLQAQDRIMIQISEEEHNETVLCYTQRVSAGYQQRRLTPNIATTNVVRLDHRAFGLHRRINTFNELKALVNNIKIRYDRSRRWPKVVRFFALLKIIRNTQSHPDYLNLFWKGSQTQISRLY